MAVQEQQLRYGRDVRLGFSGRLSRSDPSCIGEMKRKYIRRRELLQLPVLLSPVRQLQSGFRVWTGNVWHVNPEEIAWHGW